MHMFKNKIENVNINTELATSQDLVFRANHLKEKLKLHIALKVFNKTKKSINDVPFKFQEML